MKPVFIEDGIFLTESSDADSSTDKVLFKMANSNEHLSIRNDLLHQPPGIKSFAAHIGVCKKGTPDFSIIRLDQMGVGKAVYTQSLTCSDAVRFDRENTKKGDIQALCVISKNANAFTPRSAEDITAIAARIENTFGIPIEAQIISCTGVIGVPLPIDLILNSISEAKTGLKADNLLSCAKAILTTDKMEKCVSIEFNGIILCGFAKGAGMIEPNMATMLVYFFTNARIEKNRLDQILRDSVNKTFNAISVDTDTSTSDTVALISTNEREISRDEEVDFGRALTAMCFKLSRDILIQAEGAGKIIEAEVALPSSKMDAQLFAKKIINSPLIKTAVFGHDPNWGRVVMAIGKPSTCTKIGEIQPRDLKIEILGETVFRFGNVQNINLKKLSEKIAGAKTVNIRVEIGAPTFSAKAWGCDMGYDYVKVNAEYTT